MIAGAGSRSSRGRRSFTKRGGGCCCLFFFFFLYEWRAAATAAAGSAARAVPPPSLREEVKATFTPLRAWAGTVSVAGGRGGTAASGSWAESWVGEDTPRSRDFYPPQAVGRAGEREDPC